MLAEKKVGGDERRRGLLAFAACLLLAGCATPPANRLLVDEGKGDVMEAVMARKDKIVYLGSETADASKPILLMLHGATDDPTEMFDICREWQGKYNVYLYSYNYHKRIGKVARDLVKDVKELKGKLTKLKPRGSGDLKITVVSFSYSAIVFRKAVVMSEDRSVFAGATVIQLVPTAGGSFLARGMANPISAWLVSMASMPSVAENPYGHISQEVWDGPGNQKFYEVIRPEQLHTVLLEGDSHSVAQIDDENIQRRFKNGIGPNFEVLPKAPGLSHDYFVSHPLALAWLRKLLELPRDQPSAMRSKADPENDKFVSSTRSL